MTETANVLPNPPGQQASSFALIDLFIVLAKHKKRLVLMPLVAVTLMAPISFLLPNVYKSTAMLLPPQQQQSGAAALLSQLGGAASAMAGAAGIKNPNDLYVGMLRSRRVADRLIKQFDLMKVYGTDSAEKARKLLADDTVIAAGKDGLITIQVESRDQKLVARIANAYVDHLTELTRVLAVTEASQRRMFFERQLEMAKNNLGAAEASLKGTMESHGVVSVEVDSRAVAETVGRLRTQISAKEVQLGSLKAFVTLDNPEYKRTAQELASLRVELSRLENGRPGAAVVGASSGLKNIMTLRDVKYNQMLYEMLAKQYEVARLDEAKDSAVIQVLDNAIEPERKFKPMRGLMVLMAGVLGLFGAMAWAFIAESRERAMQSPESAAKLARLKGYLRLRK